MEQSSMTAREEGLLKSGNMPVHPLKQRSFTAKLLLIGEHSVIEGSEAIVIPFPKFSASLQFGSLDSDEVHDSNTKINAFLKWIRENVPDLIDADRLELDVQNGLFFSSTIPQGYGLGSSGALCAALYTSYGKEVMPLDEIYLQDTRMRLSSVENYFHGKSSGIDPLCIYYNQQIVVRDRNTLITWDNPMTRYPDIRIFLIDTGLTGKTGDLVLAFRNKLMHRDMQELFNHQYIPLVNQVVDAFVNMDPDFELLYELSVFQLHIFSDLIPGEFINMWHYGNDSGMYAMKLCGSGGGGYLLGFTGDAVKTEEVLREYFGIEVIWI
jgi:mevalonate kinase